MWCTNLLAGIFPLLIPLSALLSPSALRNRCEKSLMSSITVSNCIRFYEVAEEIDASVLRDHCSNLISAHWTDFTAKDFAAMGAPLLFKMFKVRSTLLSLSHCHSLFRPSMKKIKLPFD